MGNFELSLPSFNGPVLTIREGKSIDPDKPKKVSLSGDIKTVSSFIGVRKTQTDGVAGLQTISLARSIIEVSKEKGTIKLFLDPESETGCEVLATLEPSDEIKRWGINTGKQWNHQELIKQLRFNRLDFDDKELHDTILKAYQAFNFTSFIESVNESDQRGNAKKVFNKEVKTGLPERFVLNIPIFKSFPSVRFPVTICLETTEGSASFWMESTELHELINTEKEKIINTELASCEGFVIINK